MNQVIVACRLLKQVLNPIAGGGNPKIIEVCDRREREPAPLKRLIGVYHLLSARIVGSPVTAAEQRNVSASAPFLQVSGM